MAQEYQCWSFMPFPTAVLHMSIRVIGSPYTQEFCFLGTVETFTQGSNTIFVTACLGVFSWWLYVYARLAGDLDGSLDI
jgi:hypothetical protein